jgi:hypothetical protein
MRCKVNRARCTEEVSREGGFFASVSCSLAPAAIALVPLRSISNEFATEE